MAEATSEDSPLRPLSFYGLTKKVQEEMLFMFARTYGVPACALRYQNVYGPGQSLSNPYTGILAIFSGLARAGSPILVFEDGCETRDFVFIEDVVEATWRFIADPRDLSGSFNVGRGERITVLQVANEIARFFGNRAPVSVTGAFREGDIRHNFANLSKMCAAIGFTPRWSFAEGLPRFLEWAKNEEANVSEYRSSLLDMAGRGLLHE
jgi:dTDP-L-rhamnose 4-epimerase